MNFTNNKLAFFFLLSTLIHSLIFALPESYTVHGDWDSIPVTLAVYQIEAVSIPMKNLSRSNSGIKKQTMPAREQTKLTKSIRHAREIQPNKLQKDDILTRPEVFTKQTIHYTKQKQMKMSPRGENLSIPINLPKKSQKEKRQIKKELVKTINKSLSPWTGDLNFTEYEESENPLREEISEQILLEEGELEIAKESIIELASINSPRDLTESDELPSEKERMSKSENLYIQARYVHITKPEYPSEARRNGWEGTTVLKVLISQSGTTTRIEIQQSSGFQILDKTAMEAIKAWRFVPAHQGNRKVESWVKIPIVFRLTTKDNNS